MGLIRHLQHRALRPFVALLALLAFTAATHECLWSAAIAADSTCCETAEPRGSATGEPESECPGCGIVSKLALPGPAGVPGPRCSAARLHAAAPAAWPEAAPADIEHPPQLA